MTDSHKNVLVVAETTDGGLRPVSLELVTAGKHVAAATGGSVTALVIGSGIDDAVAALSGAGVDRVLVADDARLGHLTSEAATAVLVAAIQQ